MRPHPNRGAGDNLLTIVAGLQVDRPWARENQSMRKTLVVVTLVLAMGACARTTPPDVSTLPPAAPTTTAPATTRPPSAATSSSSATPSGGSSFDTLPAGYSYAYLYKLTQVSGRWSVVLDPVTMCMYPSTDPNCKDLTEPPPNDYEIRNINPRTYTVPLAAGTVLSVVGPSGEQTPLEAVPMAEKTWSTSSTGPQVIVTYSTNPAGEVSRINEWWHP
jgi:hypothetical protein